MKQTYFRYVFSLTILLVGYALLAQTNCDPHGDGNPDNPDFGNGQGTGDPNAISWDDILNNDCSNGLPFFDLITGTTVLAGAFVPKDYDPSDLCNHSSNLIPPAGSETVEIAIIDSGVRPTAPGEFNRAPLLSKKVDSDGRITNKVAHPHPHGTFSAGVISGMLYSQLGYGTYSFIDYQVLDINLRTSLTAVVAAINDAVDEEKVDVIALSIGFVPVPCDNINWESENSPLYAAILRAERAGVIVVTSAGNDENDLGVAPQYPAAYTRPKNVITVGALDCEYEFPAEFSNFGEEEVDLFTTGAFVKVLYDGCEYEITGTSFATSIVAGNAALHFSRFGEAETVMCALETYTKPFSGHVQYSLHGILDVKDQKLNCRSTNPSLYSIGFGNKATTARTTVSPNPFQDRVMVTLTDPKGALTLTLFDAQGRAIITQKPKRSQTELNLQHLPAGAYWLRIQDENGSETRTIVKQ